ncbi:cobalamin-dependent protein [Mucilaginibacter sp. UC70_90]
MNKILLFNPRSANNKYRIPNSILNIAASVDGKYDWVIVDGNCELDPMVKIDSYLRTGEFKYFGFTVMPGPQLKQAITAAKTIKQRYPNTKMIWGGYFPSNQPNAVLYSGYVDFIINGPGDQAFPRLD